MPRRVIAAVALMALFWQWSEAMAKPSYEVAYATYFGGSENEQAREVIPLADGSVLVGGQTYSADLATTPGVVQPKYAGDDPALGAPGIYGGDCYLVRLSADGGIYLVGHTASKDFPVTTDAAQKELGGKADAFVVKLVPGR